MDEIAAKEGEDSQTYKKRLTLNCRVCELLIEVWYAALRSINKLPSTINNNDERWKRYEGSHEGKRARLNQLTAMSPLLAMENRAEYITQMTHTLNYLENEYRQLIVRYVGIINRVLPEVFKDYFAPDIDEIKASAGDGGYDIIIEVMTKDPRSGERICSVNPRKFLNTFRFKLFCFLMKFALASCVKIDQKINFPFVVDDVFDSSDFAHRREMGSLVGNLVEINPQIEGMSDKPLQLIFFTQDDIIADMIVRRGFYNEGVKFARLVGHYESESDNNNINTIEYKI